ncbi:L,D-transpeptidase [Curtobacterium sp. RRHDQ10]|uniref:L,D-transpeptidase n=1 Tax=Curtobacterium phyllosphaerae TaxID=3413379 RepID=UPI003BF3CA79
MNRRGQLAAGGAAAVVAAVGLWIGVGTHVGADRPTPSPTAVARSTPTPTPSLAAVPAAPDASALAALPEAYFDGVVPGLLDGSVVTPDNQWEIATPRAPLVALFASPAADATPIATLSATVPTIDRPAATAVWGRSPGLDGGMVLVSTPARNRVPGDGGMAEAPSATFAWARAADFTLTPADRMVRIDVAASTIAIVNEDGSVGATETARLGTPADPTPVSTATYMEANYVDPQVRYTNGHPIALTGAHSSRIASYGGNSALTALHYYPDPTGSSHGCVRVSAAMTDALATLPVGTAIQFS